MNHANLLYGNLAGLALTVGAMGSPIFSNASFATVVAITGAHFLIQSPTFAQQAPKVSLWYETSKPKSSIVVGVAGAFVASRFF